MDKTEKAELQSMNVAADKRRQLAQLFPEVVTETRTEDGQLVHAVDLEKLKGVLGEFSEVLENQRERYGMTWPGKNECLKIIQQPSVATLKPCRGESVNFDETENLFIEGDNLEVLKLLQKAYYGKVKMIYIDPPYNTGSDFIYPDDYSETLETYLAYTGQIDDEGRKFSTNTESEGRYHSKWLRMMYPRLYLARNLLAEEGVIFISIDDNELTNLRHLLDEMFGEECFVGQVTVLCNPKGRSQDKYLATCHEFLLVYSKAVQLKGTFSVRKSDAEVASDFRLEDSRGKYRELELRNTHREYGKHNRPNLYYPFYVSEDMRVSLKERAGFAEVLPNWDDGYQGCWTWDYQKAEADIERIVARQVNGKRKIYRKAYAAEPGEEPRKQLKSIWLDKRHHTEKGQAVFNALFNTTNKIFPSPKSLDVLTDAIKMAAGSEFTVLDFFAGSCTTAHAALRLNAEDGGKRRFIMVQLPEPCSEGTEAYKAGYKTIADIGKERIRRAGKTLQAKPLCDYGFRVFKLDRSNFRLWDGSQPSDDPEKIARQLELHEQHIDPNATPEDILYELLLKTGSPLTTKVEKVEMAGKEVFSIAEGALLICLQDEITTELIKAMADANPLQVICLDSGFKNNDQLKANAVQTFKMRNRGKDKESSIVFRTV